MANTDIQISICGSAGDGTIAVGGILRSAMAQAGFKVIAFDVFPAEIRGFGKCISRTRITTEQSYSLKAKADLMVSLDDSHAIPHVKEVRERGAIIYESNPIYQLKEGQHITAHIEPSHLPYGVSMRELSEKATSANRSRNIVALGYMAGLLKLDASLFHKTIADKFKKKATIVTTSNIAAFDLGYKTGMESFKFDDIKLGKPKKAKNGNSTDEIIMTNGNAAVVKGCLDAGIKTFFGYPITPATTIMEGLAVQMPKHGGRFLQTEDEIAALSAVIGAGYTGGRSASATSGPGLALMTEMIGLGVMAEIPAVIFVSQRGGPSTGMPTKTEQADLNIAVYGGAGDCPRIVLAPTNVRDCYRCAGKAFEMAEKYQTPVIVLLDLYLSNRLETVAMPKKSPFAQNMNKGLKKSKNGELYLRYAASSDNISPRAFPGEKGGRHTITGLEHNIMGRPDSEPDNHQYMSKKRHEKLQAALKHPGINLHKRFGNKGKVSIGLIGWGSTFGECLEAMSLAHEAGINCAALKVVMLSPLPADAINEFMDDCDIILVPEVNYGGQFADLLQSKLSRKVHRFNQVTGTPMQEEDIFAEMQRLLDSNKTVKKVA